MAVRDWLQLFRSHTSPLEITICVLGAALAHGTVFHIDVLLLGLFGWLYHNIGYGQNSVEDYARGFDRKDPHKAHHPLQRGLIDVNGARKAVSVLMAATFGYALYLAYPSALAITVLVFAVLMGLVYNFWGKRMKGKFLPIALAHSMLFPFSYLAAGGHFSYRSLGLFNPDQGSVMVLFFVFFLIQIVYQILIEGDLKDMDMIKEGEASLLDVLGVKLEGGRFTSPFRARFFSGLLKIINCTVAILIILSFYETHNPPLVPTIALILFSIMVITLDGRLMAAREFDHSETLKDMALMEIATVFMAVAAIMPMIGGLGAALIILFDIVYFALMNRYLWGTTIKPKV